MPANADFGLRLDIAQLVCDYVHDLHESHWGPSIPYPCSLCVAFAEGIIELSPKRQVRAMTPNAETEMLYPADRPRWLGEFQPWPCGRCGREVDDSERHRCVLPNDRSVR